MQLEPTPVTTTKRRRGAVARRSGRTRNGSEAPWPASEGARGEPARPLRARAVADDKEVAGARVRLLVKSGVEVRVVPARKGEQLLADGAVHELLRRDQEGEALMACSMPGVEAT